MIIAASLFLCIILGSPTDLALAGTKLTVEQAAALEQQVDRDPGDLDARLQLLGYYTVQRTPEARAARIGHALWIIRNRPSSPVAGVHEVGIRRSLDEKAYAEAREAWLQHIESHPDDPVVLGNAASFFTLNERPRAIELTTRLAQLGGDPCEPQRRLGHLHALDVLRGDAIDAGTAGLALQAFEKALTSCAENEHAVSAIRQSAAHMAFYAGELEKANRYATEVLENAGDDGRAIHHGNLVLGQLALAAGDVEGAERHLLAAARTKGSPDLRSFGPSMMLAKSLIDVGRRKAVIDYLRLCGEFWKRSQVHEWIAIIEKGETPDFGANLRY